jgi:hypothetical protein
VNITFVQRETFNGSRFPASKMDHAFVSESGPTYANGPQMRGKRIVEFVLDANGNRVSGPTTLVEYRGTGQGSVVGLAAGPDGLYFTEMYEDSGAGGPTAPGARIFRVRYVNPSPAGDYNTDGVVNDSDYGAWRATFGSNLMLGADGNRNGVVDTADYVIWRKARSAAPATAAILPIQDATAAALSEPESPDAEVVSTIDDALATYGFPETSDISSPTKQRVLRQSTGVPPSRDDDLALLRPTVYRSAATEPGSLPQLGRQTVDDREFADLDEVFASYHVELLKSC